MQALALLMMITWSKFSRQGSEAQEQTLPCSPIRTILLGEGCQQDRDRFGSHRPQQTGNCFRIHSILLGTPVRGRIHCRVSCNWLFIRKAGDEPESYSMSTYYLRYSVFRSKINRDYGERNISVAGPFRISGLKPGFMYCADITAFNDCGHGPFCIACFENIATLDT